MVGNISTKLLTAAIITQYSMSAKLGARCGDLAAAMAICCAATVHLTRLLVFIGLLGAWLVSIVPVLMIEVASLGILRSHGCGAGPGIREHERVRSTAISITIAMALLLQFLIVPAIPKMTRRSCTCPSNGLQGRSFWLCPVLAHATVVRRKGFL